MNEKQIFEKLQEIISETLGIKKVFINLETDLIQELGADSLDMIELFYRTIDEFHIEIKNSIEEDSLRDKFFQNPTPKTLMDFAKEKSVINNHVNTPSIQQSKPFEHPLFKAQETKLITTPVSQTKQTFVQKVKQTWQRVRG